MVNQNTISIIVPALNEEKNIANLTEIIIESVNKHFDDYEILIFNDGSTDRTGRVANLLAYRNPKIKAIHNDNPLCLGGIYKRGRAMAKMHYLMLINGKNDTYVESLDRIFALKGKYDIVIPYTENMQERSFIRLAFSKTFTWLLNVIFRLKLKYYNHYCLHKRKLINSVNIKTNGYAFQAEVLIKLIKAGHSYCEVGVMDRFEKGVKTKAFRFQNVYEVSLFFINMIFASLFGNKLRKNNEITSTS